MDRSSITILSLKQASEKESSELDAMTPSERFQTITYLRECFYGAEATTGRLQRVYRVLKQ